MLLFNITIFCNGAQTPAENRSVCSLGSKRPLPSRTLARWFHRPATIDTNIPPPPRPDRSCSPGAPSNRGVTIHSECRKRANTRTGHGIREGADGQSLITTASRRENFRCDAKTMDLFQLMQHNKNPSVKYAVLLRFFHCSQHVESLTSFRHHRPSFPGSPHHRFLISPIFLFRMLWAVGTFGVDLPSISPPNNQMRNRFVTSPLWQSRAVQADGIRSAARRGLR